MPALAFLSAVFGGGSLVTLITFLITRKDNLKKEQQTILKEIQTIKTELMTEINGVKTEIQEVRTETTKIKEEAAEERAITARVRILRFEDDLQEGKKPSKDSFDQVLTDISRYNNYCKSHPDFQNDQTQLTADHIKNKYTELLESSSFFSKTASRTT